MSIHQSQHFKKDGKSVTLYVISIPPEVTENALRNLFSTFGNVTLVNILPPKHGQTCKAGFVEYENLVQAELAIENLNGIKLGEYTLKVEKARPRKPKHEEGEKNDYLSLIQKLEKGPLMEKELLDITNNNNAGNFKNPLLSGCVSSVSKNFQPVEKLHCNKISSNTASISTDFSQNQGTFTPFKEKRNPCEVCGQLTKSMCSSCSSVFYCGRNCQVQDWRRHKQNCNHNNSRKSKKTETDEDSDTPLIVVDSSVCDQVAKKLKAVIKQSTAGDCVKAKDEASDTTIISFTSQISCGDLLRFSVTDVDAENASFICQSSMPNDIDSLNELQVSLNQFYNSGNALKAKLPKVGNVFATVYAEDGQWYRAVVERIFFDGKALVKFVDYGNKEMVQVDNLYVLEKNFSTQCAFALNCKLDGIKRSEPWNDKAMEYILKALSGSNLIIDACIAEVVGDVAYAEVKANGVGMAENLLHLGCVSPMTNIGKVKNDVSECVTVENINPALHKMENKIIQKENPKLEGPVKTYEERVALSSIKVPDGSFQMIISHTSSPDSIFCQLIQKGLVELQTQFQELSQICSSQKAPSCIFEVGDICAAMFPEDNVWYRAKIVGLEEKDGLIKVQFVDFGNTEIIPKQLIQKLPSQFTLLPIQAFEASLSGCYAKENTWSEDCLMLIKTWQNKSFSACVDGTCADTGKPSLTVMVDRNSSLNELLVREKYALEKPYVEIVPIAPKFDVCNAIKKQKPSLGESVDIIITECNQPGEFFCQLVSEQLQELAKMLLELTKHCTEAPTFQFDCLPEMFCSALFKDGAWYRAQIKQVDGDTIFVEYVDYGNSALISKNEVQLLPAMFGSLPVQAFKCVLADAKPVCKEGWCEEFINVTQKLVGKCLHAKIVSHDDMLFIKVPDLLNSLIVEKCALYCI